MTGIFPRALSLTLGLVVLSAIIVTRLSTPATAGQVGEAPTAGAVSPQLSSGIAPLVTLPGNIQPIAGEMAGSALHVVGRGDSTDELNLLKVATDGSVSRTALGIEMRGFRLGFATASDGTSWVGVDGSLLRVDRSGAVKRWAVPVPVASAAMPFAGPPAAIGLPPLNSGQITALALDRDGHILIGRAGAAEITSFDPVAGSFSHQLMPPGLGDVEQFAQGPGGQIIFTVLHSSTKSGILYDAVGLVTPAGIRVLPFRARAVSGGSTFMSLGGVDGLGLIDANGLTVRQPLATGRYDESRIATLIDGTTVTRGTGGTNSIIFVARDGSEMRRVEYQVPIVRSPAGGDVPYASSLVFLSAATDGATWFGLFGSAAVYRVAP